MKESEIMKNNLLSIAINNYKNHILNVGNIEAINERKERKEYYQSWTKEKIYSMSEDDFVEYIGKLWSMLVWGNKKYISDKIIELNGFERIKENLINLLYGEDDIVIRWNSFYKNIKQIGPSTMSELLSYKIGRAHV